MGKLADAMRATIEEMKREDKKRTAELMESIRRIKRIAKTLEDLEAE